MLRHTLHTVGLGLLVVCATASPHADSESSWLDRVNFYRASASLPPVIEDPALSGAVLQHARYMVMHGVVRHSQNRRDSGATPEGAAAAAVSNLAASIHSTEPDSWAVDVWMQAPFHAIGILDPALQQVGWGIHRAQKGKVQTAAGLDVIRCPGYSAPTGLPLIVQLGSDGELPHVTDSWIADDEGPLEHCVFDGGTYRNRDAAQQRLARTILALRDAIVLIPRQPLRSGPSYHAIVDVNGRRIEWRFRVDRSADEERKGRSVATAQ